ncbi:MAG: tetratricopeptide repeat protein [Acidobacteriota bacterium]
MKRCPECRRDYADDTLSFCLEDGTPLVQGSVPVNQAASDEPATAILHITDAVGEAPTRAQIYTTEKTAVLPSGIADVPQKGFDKRLIAAPILVVIIALGVYLGYRYVSSSGSEQINSIAVLPFENRSGNPDSEYLSDGLSDSLIYRLTQLPNLKVSPTSSVVRYKGKQTDIAEIAKELDVDAVMSGKLAQRGDDLTISVELIDARSKKLIWAEQYDRKMADLLATQREIATTITQKLQLKLSGDDAKGITKKYTDNNEAYQCYLKGRYHFAKRSKDDILKGIDYFQQAIRLDPNFALAYARISDSFLSMPAYPYMAPTEAYPQAKAAASRAVETDPTLAEGHTFLGMTLAICDHNWPESEREFKRGIELDPNSASAHFRYGQIYLADIGRIDEAITETKRALELEPLDLNMGANLAWLYLFARQNDKALDQAKKVYEMEPTFPVARWMLGEAYVMNGMYQESLALNEPILQADPTSQYTLRNVGVAYAKLGSRNDAEQSVQRYKDLRKTQYVLSYRFASLYAAMGDRDQAFAELERAFNEQDWQLQRIKVDPFMDPLRGDPRFKDLLKRMNLPE